MDSEDALSAFLYFVTAVTSLGAAGSTAEICALVEGSADCDNRVKAFIAFEFLTAFAALFLLVVSAFSISIIKRFESIVSPFTVLFAIIGCAIGTSSRTRTSTISALLAWYGLIPASGAMFLAFKNMGQLGSSKAKIVDPNPVSVALNGSVASSVPMQPVQQTYMTPGQPVVGTPYSAAASPVVNTTS